MLRILYISLLLFSPSLLTSGCIRAEERRNVKIQIQDQSDFEAYLTELEKASTVLTILQGVISIPGVLEKVPVSFSNSLKETSNTIRYLSSPKLEVDQKKTKLTAWKMEVPSVNVKAAASSEHKRDQMRLAAWFSLPVDAKVPGMEKLNFSYLAAEKAVDATVVEQVDGGSNRINFEEIIGLFPVAKESSEEAKFLSGLLSYSTSDAGLLDIVGKDLLFDLKEVHVRLMFSFSVNERSGSVVSGTISGKVIDPKTNGVESEYEWDLARVAKHAANFPFKIYVPDGSTI